MAYTVRCKPQCFSVRHYPVSQHVHAPKQSEIWSDSQKTEPVPLQNRSASYVWPRPTSLLSCLFPWQHKFLISCQLPFSSRLRTEWRHCMCKSIQSHLVDSLHRSESALTSKQNTTKTSHSVNTFHLHVRKVPLLQHFLSSYTLLSWITNRQGLTDRSVLQKRKVTSFRHIHRLDLKLQRSGMNLCPSIWLSLCSYRKLQTKGRWLHNNALNKCLNFFLSPKQRHCVKQAW